MAPTLESLGINHMSVDERLALIESIWDSLADDPAAIPLTDAQRAELDRRLADEEEHPDDVVPWEQVKAEALARWQKS